MSQLPQIQASGYRIERELGQNRAGGRVTYLATQLDTQQPVVLKQFLFAGMSGWSAYDTYEREIQVLRGLKHPGIPRYLDSFETPDGFCLVQEYKNARSLAEPRSFDPEQVKQIAIALLSILEYLQNRIPPVIHRDIKPENVLVSDDRDASPGEAPDDLQVYLVDFGFARIGDGDVAISSVVKGTLGFMPPEQLFNRQLTEASDLYGVGATLICLLAGIPSRDIGDLMDDRYALDFESRVPKLSLPWIAWLKKMVEPQPANRYANAAAAREALKPLYVNRVPAVKVASQAILLEAKRLGETVSETLVVRNPIANTELQGTWEVLPHPKDLPSRDGKHHWIRVSPGRVEGNKVLCRVRANTGKLVANSVYQRELVFRSNGEPDSLTVSVTVKTAPAPIRVPHAPMQRLWVLLLSATVLSFGVDTWWGATMFVARSLARAIDGLWM